jgi:hypothetical protein
MASNNNMAGLAIDPENRYFWRMYICAGYLSAKFPPHLAGQTG